MVGEMWDHAPACWSTMDRHIMGVLAEFASDETRECFPGGALLAHRLGIQEDSLSRAFRSLRDKGYEVRVALGKDRKGNPVFAYEGARVRYRLPKLCPYLVHDVRKCWPEIRQHLHPSNSADVQDGESPDRRPPTGGSDTPQSPDSGPPTGAQEPGQPSVSARTTVRQSPDDGPGHLFIDPSNQPSTPLGVRATEADPWDLPPATGEGSPPEDTQTQVIDDAITYARDLRPTFTAASVRKAIRASLDTGRRLEHVVGAITACYSDPNTQAPGRLSRDGPWWTDAEAAVRAADPEHRARLQREAAEARERVREQRQLAEQQAAQAAPPNSAVKQLREQLAARRTSAAVAR